VFDDVISEMENLSFEVLFFHKIKSHVNGEAGMKMIIYSFCLFFLQLFGPEFVFSFVWSCYIFSISRLIMFNKGSNPIRHLIKVFIC
jgi:hypothetical protein